MLPPSLLWPKGTSPWQSDAQLLALMDQVDTFPLFLDIGTFQFLCCKQLTHHVCTEVASWAALEVNLIQVLIWQLKWRYTGRRKNTRLARRRGCRDTTKQNSREKWSQWNLRLMGRGWWRFEHMLRWRSDEDRSKVSVEIGWCGWGERAVEDLEVGTCKGEVSKRMWSKADNVPYLVTYRQM